MAAFNCLLVLCFLSIAFVASDNEHRAWNSRKQTNRALKETFSWHVFMSSVKCSGVLVHDRWILSSAWCVELVKTNLNLKRAVDSDHSTTFIRVGNHHVDLRKPGEDTVPVLKTLVYPKYNATAYTNNFGLLYLARDVMLPNDLPVSQVKLPTLETLNGSIRLLAKITGWGHLSGRKSPFTTLAENDVLLTPAKYCLRSFRDKRKGRLLDDSWCAVAGTKGMCSIDQGSPVVVKQDNSWFVLGVYTNGETCSSAGRDVALFSRIDSDVLQWIKKLFTVGDKPQCQPSGHKVLDTPARAQSNQVNFAFPLCDNNLEEAWYKLELNGIPAEIPTSCPEIGSCGTYSQIWMQPAGHPEFGEERNGSACVAWEGVERFCCLWQLPVHVIHCGGFLVYHLNRTEECSTAYCAQEAGRVPCGPGKIGYAPRCRVGDLYPTLDGPPQITPVVPADIILASNSIHLLCTYAIIAPGPYRVGYTVTWYKIMSFLGGKPGKLVLLTNRTEETAVVINSRSAELYLGDTITCEVMAFFLESPDRSSPAFPSDEFFVGIKVDPSSLVISEDHNIKETTIRLTVPLVCPPGHPNCTIQIPMHLVPVVNNPRMLSAPDIALSTCEVVLKPQSCSRRDCGRKVVKLVAVSDFIYDGDRRTRIVTEPTRSQSPLWKSYDPPDVFVSSTDVITPLCYLFTESYIKTLTGRYYRVPAETKTFLLFKSPARPFEVHTRLWACSRSRNPGFCVCGVATRDGDDVIVIDMCNGRFTETSVQISIRSRLPLAKGIRITEAISGKRYTLYFPSGAYVRVDVFEWGLNVQIQSSGRDLNHVTGLCGMGEVGSFKQTANEGLPADMNGAQQWRIPDTHSLFHYKPVNDRHHQTEKPFCLCSFNSNIEKKRTCAACETKCRRHQHVIWPVLFRERDITKRVISLQAARFRERRHNLSHEFNSLTDDPSNRSNILLEDKTDTFLAVLAVTSYCKRLLTDTPLGRACNPLVGQRIVDKLQRICIRDMRFTGVSTMVWGVVAMLQDTCRDMILKNTSQWEMSSSTARLAPPMSVKNAMCPQLCSDRGRCVNGTCKCRRGYTSVDCSVPSKSPPQLISVHDDGECDVRVFHCKQVRLIGEGFHNSRELKCSFAEIKEATFETQNFLSKATYESFRGVTCEVPRSHDEVRALSGYQVRVSNDGSLWSQPVVLFILDGRCQTCSSRRMRCKIKNDTCHIDGRCYRQGESNSQDPCKWCSPKESQQKWTDIPCQNGTCDAFSCVHGVCLDTTLGRHFCFCNEGFTGLNCNVPIDRCISNPCGNGNCLQHGSTFRCECAPGYTGAQCSLPVNPCSSNPCNNGSCVTNGTHFNCFCDEGFTGPYCDTEVQSCLCRQGKCVRRSGTYVCVCEVGFTGKLCEVPVEDGCSSMSCKNGTCVENIGDAKCVCDSGYAGTFCDIKIIPCLAPPCVHGNCGSPPCLHSWCFGENYKFTCVCEFGFTGTLCHKTINATQEVRIGETLNSVTVFLYQNALLNSTLYYVNISIDGSNKIINDKHVSVFGDKKFVCQGNITTVGRIISCDDKKCRIDDSILLCMLETVSRPCGCSTPVSKQNCSCSKSFCDCYSQTEEIKNKAWSSSSYSPCEEGYFQCECYDKRTGVPCNDHNYIALSKGFVKECSEEQNCNETVDPCYLNPCVHGNCTFSTEGVRCLCETGYMGERCNDTVKDFCQPNPCWNGKCQNTGNGFKCVCPEGFTGSKCSRLKPRCKINLCRNGDCFVEANGKLSCECFNGYQGPLCETPVDRCQLDFCKNGLCVNTKTGFRCLCLVGFSGKRCHVKEVCVPNPCVNGNCTSRSDGFHCLCRQGFNGRTCNETTDYCLSNPCVHGQCINTPDTYSCQCPRGFIGDTCNETVDVCQPNPCLNGNCVDVEGSIKCECHDGFRGAFCEKRVVVDPCDRNPCSNGRCIRVEALARSGPSFYCLCHDGFSGQYCQSEVNPCKTNPCKYGLCEAINANSFRCNCFKGFQGDHCNTKINHCLSSPCKNGSCIPTNASFACLCHPGYTGSLCDQAVDMCWPNPCQHGSCYKERTSFKCSCSAGYTGDICETKITGCSLNPCKHGFCVTRGLSFKCYCKRGYSGEFCHRKVNPCKPNPCKHGSCLHRFSSWFACRCELGYTGKMCDKKINMCQSQPCKNGVCVNLGMSFRCRCFPGFHGRLCDKIETCLSRPCKRGYCIATADSFTCACPEAYTGRHCENKIDPCQSSPCEQGRCSSVNHFVKCICDKGYTGEHCQVKMNPCTSHKCKQGKCIAQGVQYSCQCLQGFKGKYCDTDVNECLESPCFAGVECTNYPGSYLCGSCPVGFTGNGLRCESITQPCENFNCFRNVPCVQKGSRYECGNCPRGLTGNGVQCTEIDACSSNPCHRLAQCITVKGSPAGFRCGPCPVGYKGNGTSCSSLCPVPCPDGMECIGHNKCRCPIGYHGVGCQTPFCQAGCYNGGTCTKPNVCVCAEGFEGPACLSPLCKPPCRYGGRCIGPGKCRCPHGFTGPRCEKKSCLVACLNGGRCRGPYVCQCMPGYLGQRCEIAPCTPKCQNGGLCVARDVCKCPAEYMGERCQYPLCRPPCINGGHCVRPNVCMCPASWKGDYCQKPVCHLPCLNGGKCARPNQCTCPSGYNGVMCEKAICNQPCLNGGQCVRPDICACPYGFTGRRCGERDPWYNNRKHES